MKFNVNNQINNVSGDNRVRFLSDDGTSNGNFNMAGDWSAAPKYFWIEAGPGEIMAAKRAIIFMSISGSIDSGGYGNGTALPVGINFYIYDAELDLYFDGLSGSPIKTNEGWGQHCYDTAVESYGSGNQSFKARWTFTKDGGPVYLKPGDKLIAVLNDDLNATRGIDVFTVKIAGQMVAGFPSPMDPQPSIILP